jgi:DUF4097 and DUF4098 domain-containing protein YvlB
VTFKTQRREKGDQLGQQTSFFFTAAEVSGHIYHNPAQWTVQGMTKKLHQRLNANQHNSKKIRFSPIHLATYSFAANQQDRYVINLIFAHKPSPIDLTAFIKSLAWFTQL